MSNLSHGDRLARHRHLAVMFVTVGVVALASARLGVELGLGWGSTLRLFGTPFEYIGISWFLGLVALLYPKADDAPDTGLRFTIYQWWMSIIGLSGTFLVIQRVPPGEWSNVAPAYWISFLTMGGLFLLTSAFPRPRHLITLRKILADARRVGTRSVTWVCAIAATVVLTVAPRSGPIPESGRAFERWYLRKVPEQMPQELRQASVNLVEMVDYQCPACRNAAFRYRGVLDAVTLRHGAAFRHISVDFPLDSECNSLGTTARGDSLHSAGCEAAAAVRLARKSGLPEERAVIDWLWNNQDILTSESVFEVMANKFSLDLRERYASVLAEVVDDVKRGRALRVGGTPAYFLNGRRLPALSPVALEAAIEVEVRLTQKDLQSKFQ